MFGSKVDDSMLHDFVEPGFEEVEVEFRRNFMERNESGAACAVYHKGKKIVDLWGGYRAQGLHDKVSGIDWSFSLGYARPFKDFKFGSSNRAFGMTGTGGSFAFADPDAQIGFAYASYKIDVHLREDPREEAVRKALYRCLEK